MITFPKKYKSQDLRNWSNINRQNINQNCGIEYSIHQLFASKKIDTSDLFLMYIKDFYNCKNNIEESKKSEDSNLFAFSNDELGNFVSSYTFFNRKRQTLQSIGINKLEKHIFSKERKTLSANNKIIESYFSSPHKIYLNDTDFYLYMLNKFHYLWSEGKIYDEFNVGYRSFTLQTLIPYDRIEWINEMQTHYVVKYFVGAKCEALPVCLQDIDLCCGDVALLVHPKDKRYNKYIGKNAIIPLSNRQIPIIGDENVNISINNGIQRVCPCADQASIAIAKKYGLPTDIKVFDGEGLYTEYIHQQAFIGQERSKYYDNIVGFIRDIGNMASEREELTKVPYLSSIHERLIPYQVRQLVIDLRLEKGKIIDKILNGKIRFSFLEQNFGGKLDEIRNLKLGKQDLDIENVEAAKQEIINEINEYIPDEFVCNSQLPYGYRLPLLIDKNQILSFFDVEKLYKERIGDSLQKCFDFVLLCLVRSGDLGIKQFGSSKSQISDSLKLCEYEKLFVILSQNEKKIQIFINYLQTIVGKISESDKFIQIIQNLTDEVNSTIDECSDLIQNSKFIEQKSERLFLDLEGVSNEVIEPEFVQLCLQSYLYSKGVNLDSHTVINQADRMRVMLDLVFEEILVGDTIFDRFDEYDFDKKCICTADKSFTSQQLQQFQWDVVNVYGENPFRLSLLTQGRFDQQDIILSHVFLKQVWNALRFCTQKGFINQDLLIQCSDLKDLDDVDLIILCKLKEVYAERKNISGFQDYIKFFSHFKSSIQDLFFCRYLEIQKIIPTHKVQFVCTYFFNLLLNILYPIVPEYVDALLYVSGLNKLVNVAPLNLDKIADFNVNMLYETFVKIKHAKLNMNIKQHESFKVFLKSTPSLLEMIGKYEQVLKNYFHITDVVYLRLHEQDIPGYDIISDDILTIGVKTESNGQIPINSIEYLEGELKELKDKSDLIRERLQWMESGQQRAIEEEKYRQVKQEIENVSIKIQLLNQ